MAKFNINLQNVSSDTTVKCDTLITNIEDCITTINGISVPFSCDGIQTASTNANTAKTRTVDYKNRLADAVEYFTTCDLNFKGNVSGIEIEKF